MKIGICWPWSHSLYWPRHPKTTSFAPVLYLREKAYSLLSDDKAATMRDNLMETLKRFGCDHSIPLPDGSTEIDLVIEDLQSSTVVIAELKWYQKAVHLP